VLTVSLLEHNLQSTNEMCFVKIFEKFERIETNQAAEGQQPCKVVKSS